MPRPKRTPGTNVPRGEWYSTPDAKRHNKPKRLSLTPEAHAALAALVEHVGGAEGQESRLVSEAICEKAERARVYARKKIDEPE